MKIPHSQASHDLLRAAEKPVATIDLATVQRRTLRVLFATQIISGIGVGIGSSVGALLAAELADISVSGWRRAPWWSAPRCWHCQQLKS